jgi:hypothetical protein
MNSEVFKNLGRNTVFPYISMFPEEDHINLQHIQKEPELLLLGCSYFVDRL